MTHMSPKHQPDHQKEPMTYDPDTGIVTDRTDPRLVIDELVERVTQQAVERRDCGQMGRVALMLREAARTLEVQDRYAGRVWWQSVGEPHPDGGRVLDLTYVVELDDEGWAPVPD